MEQKKFDAIVVGSGFGGSMTAYQLVRAGLRVLMLERGDWVRRSPENWGPQGSIDLTPAHDKSSPLLVVAGGNKKIMGLYSCVGGPSVFYGGVSFRFRERDFEPDPEIAGTSGARWPYQYRALEPFYTQAEAILNVSGETGIDPTEPPRSVAFPQRPAPLAGISQQIKTGAERMGLRPFQLPLAINYSDKNRQHCIHCTTCDTFACAVSAKNDLSVMVLPELIDRGMVLCINMVVTRLRAVKGYIQIVECVSRETGQRLEFAGKLVILAAGALASPHLLLTSGLAACNPGGEVVGRYLMRHVNAIVFGIFPGRADKENRFHKQLVILDYYFGFSGSGFGKLGSLQQLPTPPKGLVQQAVPGVLGKLLSRAVPFLTGLLAITEDQPNFANQISINPAKKDAFGLPQAVIVHHYSTRDKAAQGVLIRQAKKILSQSGALMHYVHHIRTFSHAVGTVRMGEDPATSALDEYCRYRGMENLFVVDGSFMPTSAALNPSLTISANALRVGEHISKL